MCCRCASLLCSSQGLPLLCVCSQDTAAQLRLVSSRGWSCTEVSPSCFCPGHLLQHFPELTEAASAPAASPPPCFASQKAFRPQELRPRSCLGGFGVTFVVFSAAAVPQCRELAHCRRAWAFEIIKSTKSLLFFTILTPLFAGELSWKSLRQSCGQAESRRGLT